MTPNRADFWNNMGFGNNLSIYTHGKFSVNIVITFYLPTIMEKRCFDFRYRGNSCYCTHNGVESVLKYNDTRYCCPEPGEKCTAKDDFDDGYCTGISLDFSQRCQFDHEEKPVCNYHPYDPNRNYESSRSHMDFCGDDR